nr:hypothetical protein [Microbacterium bovistercoris]
MGEVEDLQERLRALEAENAALRTTPTKPRRRPGRSILSAVLIVVGLVLAPVAAVGTWARFELVDTDTFVKTFAPLASDAGVQSFVSDQVVDAIDENVDIDGLVGSAFDGLQKLDLPIAASSALTLLQGPATQGVHTLISDAVHRAVASPAFEQLWTQALTVTHRQAIAALNGDPDALVGIGEDGTISLDLGQIISGVKQQLVDRGLTIAQAIPEISVVVPVVRADAITLVRTTYNVAVAAGYWLPWVVLGLLVAGVLVARRRLSTLTRTAMGFAAVMAALALGIGIGRQLFLSSVSPSIMPRGVANTIFDQVIELMKSAIVALLVLGILVAVGSWLAGSGRAAVTLRTVGARGFAALRATMDRHHLGTGRFGAFVERWRLVIITAAIVVAAVLVFVNRPPTTGGVFAVLGGVILVLLLVEILRRPAAPAPVEEAGSRTLTP